MKRDETAELAGKVALVSGGSRGIGLAIARGFLAGGANVVITGRRLESLAEAVQQLEADGLTAVRAFQAHTGQEAEVRRAFDRAAQEFGPVQIAVNNAATNPVMAPLAETPLEAFDKILHTNARGYLVVAQAFFQQLRRAALGGSLINVSSVAAYSSWPGLGAYSVSKAAVNAMTKILASEVGNDGIRVNAIAPGLIRTRFSEALWKDADREEQTARRLPLGRLGEPEDLVGAAVFLASDASRYVTGETIVVDGGMLTG